MGRWEGMKDVALAGQGGENEERQRDKANDKREKYCKRF